MPGLTLTVSNAADMKKAITTLAKTGGTVLLNPGDYGSYTFNGVAPKFAVTIKSADPDHDAMFRQITVNHSSKLVFDDIDVRHAMGIDSDTAAITVNKSSAISFVGMDIAGSLDGNSWNDGRGIVTVLSDHVSVLDSTLKQFSTAMAFSRSSSVIAAGNDISEVGEGVQVAQVASGLFDGNYIHGMTPNYPAGVHPDAFQVMASNTGASSDLAFRNNVIMATDGPIGGIFIRSETAAKGIEHSDISIENNYYMGTYRHGISVSDTNGLVITGNTVLDSAKVGISAAIIIENVDGARIADNIAPMYLQTASAHFTSTNNIDVWEAKSKIGVSVAALFAPVAAGMIDFDSLNPLGTTAADTSHAGFHNIGQIGNLSGSGDAIVAAHVAMFEHSFSTHVV